VAELNLEELAQGILQPVRDRWGRIKVNSGYRSAEVNAAVGGSLRSQHLHGEAADIVPLDADIYEVFQWIRDESGIDYGQLILEKKGGAYWIHISLPRPDGRNLQALLIIDGVRSYA
jgi:hypothetical protein